MKQLLRKFARSCITLLCVVLLVPGDVFAGAQQAPAAAPTQQAAPRIPAAQLDSLVAPVALYPDNLLAQVLAASTYPLEIIQLHQWLLKHPTLKDKQLEEAVLKENWDPSVQAMAAIPDVAKRLADDIKWTTDLGNAFLEQQADLMDAIQRMRKAAEQKGNLKSGSQQLVETKVVESKQVIVIEQADPQVLYVPSYDPYSVWGAPMYPYPPVYYPPAGYYAGRAIAFGVGLAIGAAWGGGWGWGCGWGNNNININRNNNFINSGNRVSNQPVRGGGGNRASTLPAGGAGAGNNWQHNPQHRGGAPYGNRDTAQRFGGTSRGDSMANRQQGGGLGDRQPGAGGGLNQPQVGNRMQNTGAVGQGGRGGPSAGGDRIGNQQLGPGAGGSRDGAFSGASSGQNRSAARASSNRGSSSFGGGGRSMGGGGRSMGGGGRSMGGGRGGGGRRR